MNHFRCIDLVIEGAKLPLTEKLIKELHSTLKIGTHDSRKDWFTVGEYKKLSNEVGGSPTALPEEVLGRMANSENNGLFPPMLWAENMANREFDLWQTVFSSSIIMRKISEHEDKKCFFKAFFEV